VSRFLHISTDEVYGTIDEGSFSEDDVLTPRSPYSAAKAGSDLLALSYHTTYGLPVVVTRCSNNYGPYQFPEKLIPLFTTNLLDGTTVPLMGDGGNVRDWIHVEDHNRAAHLVFERGEIGEIYNIGAHNELTNHDITLRLLELTGRDRSAIEWVPDRLGHDRRYSVNVDKITALGWEPRRDFDTGLAHTVDWYRSNRAWWEPLKRRVELA
jgi:dTDP-glucose 4,6-dehydratase